jgi:hypothetical protein
MAAAGLDFGPSGGRVVAPFGAGARLFAAADGRLLAIRGAGSQQPVAKVMRAENASNPPAPRCRILDESTDSPPVRRLGPTDSRRPRPHSTSATGC